MRTLPPTRIRSLPPPPFTIILSTLPAGKVVVTVPIFTFSELRLLEMRMTSAVAAPLTFRMPPLSVAESIRRTSSPSTTGGMDNFGHAGALADSVDKATPGLNGVTVEEGVHNPNALLSPLLHESGHVSGKKIEVSWKKMGETGNHSGQEQPAAAGGALTPEANASLLRRLRKGDEAAYHELVDRFSGPLFRIAYSMVSNSADAEDVVQETFAAAFSGIERFRGESSLKTWLTQILVRQSARLQRSRGRRWTLPIDETQHAGTDEAAATDSKMDVVQMLQTLSPEHREVIVLRE